MRKEPYSVGSYVHIIKRGARGMNIVRDEADRWRFLSLLRYLNDDNVPRNWEREVTLQNIKNDFERPHHWQDPVPYVAVISYCLMDNHFHLLVKEDMEGGISKFMHRLCTSMTSYHNAKYGERGTLFQGAFAARTVTNDRHLQYVSAYIQVKNPLERYEGGVRRAVREFDHALEWILEDQFSSLGDFLGRRSSRLIDHALRQELFDTPQRFKSFARDVLEGRLDTQLGIERRLLD